MLHVKCKRDERALSMRRGVGWACSRSIRRLGRSLLRANLFAVGLAFGWQRRGERHSRSWSRSNLRTVGVAGGRCRRLSLAGPLLVPREELADRHSRFNKRDASWV